MPDTASGFCPALFNILNYGWRVAGLFRLPSFIFPSMSVGFHQNLPLLRDCLFGIVESKKPEKLKKEKNLQPSANVFLFLALPFPILE